MGLNSARSGVAGVWVWVPARILTCAGFRLAAQGPLRHPALHVSVTIARFSGRHHAADT